MATRIMAMTCQLFNVCYYSPTTELLETLMPLLNHCLQFYSHADRNMAKNFNVRLEVAVDSVHRLEDYWT